MVEWRISPDLVPYEDALVFMEQRVKAIRQETAPETVWLLEHPPLYTAGASASPADLHDAGGFPVYQTGRGGQYTYHGPGQRVAYVMIDLARRRRDVRVFVNALEQWVIDTLAALGIQGERRPGRVGIWVMHEGVDCKIAALGVRLRHWVSCHGISINLNPDLHHFKGIVPCGLPDYGITSFEALGQPVSLEKLDKALQQQWRRNIYLGHKIIAQGVC